MNILNVFRKIFSNDIWSSVNISNPICKKNMRFNPFYKRINKSTIKYSPKKMNFRKNNLYFHSSVIWVVCCEMRKSMNNECKTALVFKYNKKTTTKMFSLWQQRKNVIKTERKWNDRMNERTNVYLLNGNVIFYLCCKMHEGVRFVYDWDILIYWMERHFELVSIMWLKSHFTKWPSHWHTSSHKQTNMHAW